MHYRGYKSVASAVFAVVAVGGGIPAQATVTFSSDFPSGSIGVIDAQDTSGRSWSLALRNDNDNATLPNSFRTWWYLRADGIDTAQDIHLEFTGFGFPYDFRPVYSYDNRNWEYFADGEANLAPGCNPSVPTSCRMIIDKRFEKETVWIARSFPYTVGDLQGFVDSLRDNINVSTLQLGTSPLGKGPLLAIRIASPFPAPAGRKTIVIHARTHAAETGPSFVIEGLVSTLLRDDDLARRLLSRYVFRIMPMHNPDGVDLGNYRTNGTSLNLETQWIFNRDIAFPVGLLPSAADENRLINRGLFAPALTHQAEPVALALNLHSSNSAPDTAAFFFPHFGSDPAVYTKDQIDLWHRQLAFIDSMAIHYDGRIEQPPADGGAGFTSSFFPETWWWHHAKATVNAMTLETTYGRAGFDHWITRDDLRGLGEAIARAIADMDSPVTVLRNPEREAIYRAPFNSEVYRVGEEH